jgi:hypothetical protein
MSKLSDKESLEDEIRKRVESELEKKKESTSNGTSEPSAEERRKKLEDEIKQKVDAQLHEKMKTQANLRKEDVAPKEKDSDTAEPPSPKDSKSDEKKADAADDKKPEDLKADAKSDKKTDGGDKTADTASSDSVLDKSSDATKTAKKPGAKGKNGTKTGGKKSPDGSQGLGKKKKSGTKTSTDFNMKGIKAKTDTMTKHNLMIQQEKAKIDKAFQQRNLILYAAISISTILLAFIIWKVKTTMNNTTSSNIPTKTIRNTVHQTAGGESLSPELLELRSIGQSLVRQGGYAAAISKMKEHMEENPDDANFCKRYISEWQKDMPESDAWKALQRRLDKLTVRKTKEGYVRAYKALREFEQHNSNEAFRIRRPMDALVKHYNQLTNEFLNDDVANAFEDDGDGGWDDDEDDSWSDDNGSENAGGDAAEKKKDSGGGDDWWND